jgi:hypothetical protein
MKTRVVLYNVHKLPEAIPTISVTQGPRGPQSNSVPHLRDATLDLLEVFDSDIYKSQLVSSTLRSGGAILPLHIRTDPIATTRTNVEPMAIHLWESPYARSIAILVSVPLG